MNTASILYEQIFNGYVSGLDHINTDDFNKKSFTEFINDDFTIFNKKLNIDHRIEYDLKIYFYKNKFWQTGIGIKSNTRLITILKKAFNFNENKTNNKFELFRNVFSDESFAIKINEYSILKFSLCGKGVRKNFFIDTIESDKSFLENNELSNVASNFLNSEFKKLTLFDCSIYECQLLKLLNKNGLVLNQ